MVDQCNLHLGVSTLCGGTVVVPTRESRLWLQANPHSRSSSSGRQNTNNMGLVPDLAAGVPGSWCAAGCPWWCSVDASGTCSGAAHRRERCADQAAAPHKEPTVAIAGPGR